MRTELFDYPLPVELIAQRPPERRDGGRLLCLEQGGRSHRLICDWPAFVEPGSLVVLNDTRVRCARLYGARGGTGAKVELLLLSRESGTADCEEWLVLGKANRPLRVGDPIEVGELQCRVKERRDGGVILLEINAERSVEDAIEEIGHVPLPPYVERPDDAEDRSRYQTVFADHPGSSAAPTAGLHLTREMLDRLSARDIELGHTTLDVGLGTFRPVGVDDLDDHLIHAERMSVSDKLVRQVAAARARGAKVVAVGTTVVRALETAAEPAPGGRLTAYDGESRLFIQPGYRYRVTDALFTNFHMPKSTLLALVSAFAGRGRLLASYADAVKQRYRFLSYGDAMWIPKRLNGDD